MDSPVVSSMPHDDSEADPSAASFTSYSRDELLKLRSNPSSRQWPRGLPNKFFCSQVNGRSLWDPVQWLNKELKPANERSEYSFTTPPASGGIAPERMNGPSDGYRLGPSAHALNKGCRVHQDSKKVAAANGASKAGSGRFPTEDGRRGRGRGGKGTWSNRWTRRSDHQEAPEWYTEGPTSQFDTLPLEGLVISENEYDEPERYDEPETRDLEESQSKLPRHDEASSPPTSNMLNLDLESLLSGDQGHGPSQFMRWFRSTDPVHTERRLHDDLEKIIGREEERPNALLEMLRAAEAAQPPPLPSQAISASQLESEMQCDRQSPVMFSQQQPQVAYAPAPLRPTPRPSGPQVAPSLLQSAVPPIPPRPQLIAHTNLILQNATRRKQMEMEKMSVKVPPSLLPTSVLGSLPNVIRKHEPRPTSGTTQERAPAPRGRPITGGRSPTAEAAKEMSAMPFPLSSFVMSQVTGVEMQCSMRSAKAPVNPFPLMMLPQQAQMNVPYSGQPFPFGRPITGTGMSADAQEGTRTSNDLARWFGEAVFKQPRQDVPVNMPTLDEIEGHCQRPTAT